MWQPQWQVRRHIKGAGHASSNGIPGQDAEEEHKHTWCTVFRTVLSLKYYVYSMYKGHAWGNNAKRVRRTGLAPRAWLKHHAARAHAHRLPFVVEAHAVALQEAQQRMAQVRLATSHR